MKIVWLPVLSALLFACASKPNADLLVYNARVYTVDSAFGNHSALLIRDGKVMATGGKEELEKTYRIREFLDAEGGFIYPGFIDAHAHFMNYGYFLRTVNLVDTRSWQEAIDRTRDYAVTHPDGWILGRGWDQNDWEEKSFPDKTELDRLFPDRPVLLRRIDGHAALVNQRALDLAGIRAGDKLTGGEIITRNGQLTGLLIDNAIDLVTAKIPVPDRQALLPILQEAEGKCFAAGLTTVTDCGDEYSLGYRAAEYIQQYHRDGSLKMRLYLMLPDLPENYRFYEKNGPVRTERLQARAIKVYGDGALGSRGACLLEPYSDQPGHFGFLLSKPAHFDSVAAWCAAHNIQMCTHAIGDSGNRSILHIYAKYLEPENDRRWRIEHAQVVQPSDFARFGQFSVVPSVQPTHATSDMYWAGKRLGQQREKGAYAYRELLQQNGWLPLGTDFPVEDISPIATFYAAVVRKDAKGWPETGYQPENALSREDALRGMTIWAARANFEEKEKGSLEKGKWADFVILDQDLLQTPDSSILRTRVRKTFVNGEQVYPSKINDRN